MLSKFALIIGYPGEPGEENFCEGVNTDVANFQHYLKSIHGGAWNDDEIHAELNISKRELKKWIIYLSNFDYSVIIFAGHGEYNTIQYQTEIQINKYESILENELITQTERQLIMLDCCRVKGKTLVEDSFIKSFSLESSSHISKDIYRMLFDNNLSESVQDLIKVYSCSINETARDLGIKGGLFSKSLIDSAKGNENLSIYKTFSKAKDIVITQSRNKQHPQIEKPRSGLSFPFYIS